jgi:Na+-transporting NADH:ubiquinone oxidoreductase subunit A
MSDREGKRPASLTWEGYFLQVHIRGGIDLRWEGKPIDTIEDAVVARSVALMGEDYPRLRPVIDVAIGQAVRAGERLFTDRHRPHLTFTAPVAGTIRAISRGARRSLDSIIIDVEDEAAVEFDRPSRPDRMTMQSLLLQSGCWQSFRTRPFGRLADPRQAPDANHGFVSARRRCVT